MLQNNNVKRISRLLIPSTTEAVRMYTLNGGCLTIENTFGCDPLFGIPMKQAIRRQFFEERCPCFEIIFSQAVNGNNNMFKQNLLLYINITKRLALSQ